MKPRTSRLKSGGDLKRSRIKPKRRTKAQQAAKFAREYGGEARHAFVASLPCVACGRVGYADNAHVVKGDGGMSYKASARFIAPLCGSLWSIVNNCHGELHRIGPGSFEAKYGINLAERAAQTDAAWRAYRERVA